MLVNSLEPLKLCAAANGKTINSFKKKNRKKVLEKCSPWGLACSSTKSAKRSVGTSKMFLFLLAQDRNALTPHRSV